MLLSDTREIKADPKTVWDAILNPDVLMECIPGCQSLTGSVAEGYEAVVKQKVGPVSATFTGLVQLSDIIEGKSLKISGEGKGGVAGFAKGGANVSFEPIDGGTRLTYEAEANVGGKIAQLGSRIIDSFAKKLADEFFTRFQAAVEDPEEDPEEVTEEAVADSGEKKKGWFKRLLG
ncbi:MAG: carbon monoxide dehydrogenase subunit G [Tabrizicola sp.]|uniref:CoxG family protein n=1 Tax=Tabrizicola sp. TaxID=2005166 RepID=UPI002ABAB398|nr:carbon monoxide dehydrogenase subunit G [Tabrizicola sp.]MDZ4087206.1 carbon monoxide dehydrogenase subunit G [Tabrizicola sp.]